MQTKYHLTLLITLFLIYGSSSQSCLPFGITFSSQQEIDDFASNYPDCIEIGGNVWIQESSENDITNLNGLLPLTSIQGGLWIDNNNTLNNLSGLSHLSSLSGSLYIQNNAILTNLNGLHNIDPFSVYALEPFEDLKIINNAMLSECEVSSVCQILSRPGVTSLIYGNATGCNNVIDVVSSCDLPPSIGIIFTNQQQIDDFPTNYPELTQINGNVWIVESIANAITNLNGLSQLVSIRGELWIENNNMLTDLSGLEHLISIERGLVIQNNNALMSLSGLNNISSIGSDFWLSNNDALTNLAGLEQLSTIGMSFILKNNNALINLFGLELLSSVNGYFSIENNDALTNLAGLEQLSFIGGYFYISHNNVLINLTGAENLLSTGDYFYIDDNPALIDLSGLINLATVEGYLTIKNNDALTNLAGLENLMTIKGGLTIIENATLTNIEGIQYINSTTIKSTILWQEDLQIYNNPILAICEVQSVCGVLAIPGATTDIHDNAIGCNNSSEIEVDCIVPVSEIPLETVLNVYPNPTSKLLFISTLDNKQINNILIYNQLGQLILRTKATTINVSHLTGGIYILHVETEGKILLGKLVVER